MALSEAQRKEVQGLLEKRATFKRGVRELTEAVCACELGPSGEEQLRDLFPLVQRTHTLLRTRSNGIEFLRSGLSLFSVCEHRSFPAQQLSKIRQFSIDISTFLKDLEGSEGDDSTTTGAAGSTVQSSRDANMLAMLMEEQSRQPESHFDDAGPIIDESSERWRRAQISGFVPEPTSSHAEGATDSLPGASTAAQTRRQMRQELQRSIMEGIQNVYSGMEAVSRGTEAIGRELDSILDIINVGQQPSRPPASKKVLASLPVIDVTEQQLEEWGPECMCAVCTCEMAVGDKVQVRNAGGATLNERVLPCRHMFHPACVAPWLTKNCSCPVCRKELPTDDPRYEARKETEAEELAERSGAANAIGSEYIYL